MRTAAYKVDAASDRRDNSRNSQSVFHVVQLRSKQGEYNEDNRFKEKADKSHSGCYYDGFRNVC